MVFKLYLNKTVKEVVIKTYECISRNGEIWSMSHCSESKNKTKQNKKTRKLEGSAQIGSIVQENAGWRK